MESSQILNSSFKTNYLVKFETEKIPNLEYYIKTIPLPGYNISTNTVHSTSAQPIEYYGGMLTFKNDISFDLILDQMYDVRRAIDAYMFSVRNQTSGLLNQQSFDVSIYILSNKGNPIRQLRLKNFLMKDVGDIQNDVTTDTYQSFTVSGSIRYYEWVDLPTP